jgi:hypothetical protein
LIGRVDHHELTEAGVRRGAWRHVEIARRHLHQFTPGTSADSALAPTIRRHNVTAAGASTGALGWPSAVPDASTRVAPPSRCRSLICQTADTAVGAVTVTV